MKHQFTSKKQLVSFLKSQLSTMPNRALLALVRVYSFHNEDEIRDGKSNTHDLKGFDTFDDKIMMSIAKQYIDSNSISEKQMEIVMKKIPKYANQLINNSLKIGLIRKEGKFYIW